jgi:predicted acylesterase/phospholipase RssA
VLPPVVIDDRVLVDGGVLDNLPVGPMIDSNEGPVIAVNVVDSTTGRVGQLGPRVPGLQETLMRAMTMVSGDTVAAAAAQVSMLVTPEHGGVGLLEFHQIDAMREAGRRAARIALESIGGPEGLFVNT